MTKHRPIHFRRCWYTLQLNPRVILAICQWCDTLPVARLYIDCTSSARCTLPFSYPWTKVLFCHSTLSLFFPTLVLRISTLKMRYVLLRLTHPRVLRTSASWCELPILTGTHLWKATNDQITPWSNILNIPLGYFGRKFLRVSLKNSVTVHWYCYPTLSYWWARGRSCSNTSLPGETPGAKTWLYPRTRLTCACLPNAYP